MLTEQPLLTIAIPTFNRSRFLGLLLNTLKSQLKDEPRVELLISNNGSTDDTKSLIERFCQEGLVATCLHNESNIGADGNFLQCFQKSSGRYLWIFSDDDLLTVDGIKKILDLISQTEYDLIYVNSYSFDENLRRSHASNAAAKGPQVFTSAASFAARVHIFFTFISGNIVNRDRVLAAGPCNFSGLVGTNLVQLGWTYTALANHRKSLYVHERIVGNRAGNTGGYALCQIFGVTLQAVTTQWLPDKDCSRIILNGTLLRFLPGHISSLRSQKERSAFLNEDPHSVLRQVFGMNFRYWIFVYPVIILPERVGKVWVYLCRALNKIDKLLGSPLLRWP